MRSIITNTVSNNSDPGFWTASDLPILKSFTTYSDQINTVLYLNTFYFKGSKFSLICNRKCALDFYYASFKRVLKGGRESWIKKMTCLSRFCYLKSLIIRRTPTSMFMSYSGSSCNEIHAFLTKHNHVSVSFWPP